MYFVLNDILKSSSQYKTWEHQKVSLLVGLAIHGYAIKLLLSFRKCIREPVQTLIQSISRSCTRGLDIPCAIANRIQLQALCNLSNRQRLREILLVTEDKKNGVAQLIFSEHPVQLLLRTCLSVISITIHPFLVVR